MTQLTLPPAMAALRGSLADIVARGQERAPYFSVLLSGNNSLEIVVNNREERVTERPPQAGTVLSAFDGQVMRERAVAGFNRDEVNKAAQELVSGVSFAKYAAPEAPARRGDFATAAPASASAGGVQEKLERVRELHRRAKDLDPRIVNCQVIYRETNEYSVFANRNTDVGQQVRRTVQYLIFFVAGEDGQTRYDYRSKGTTGSWEEVQYSDEEIHNILNGALALLTAERIEPGEYQVISAPGVSGVICHESFGHGVETDMFLKERAKAAHFIDKVVGSSLVNIYDDPSRAGSYGSYFFDDEGFASAPTQIVENGIFRRGITDFYSANALGIARSANGRRQDYSRKAYARMSNTFFGAGETKLEDMLAMVDNGIYLDQWSSGMEDPQGWGIQVTCHYGHEIKGGKITDRVFAPIGISGYVPDVLGSVTAVGNDLHLDAGGCGKGHKELVAVASGGPHLLMKARLG
ncbi:MAG: TldD/PmbA family protein [Chloroflexota bacterium]